MFTKWFSRHLGFGSGEEKKQLQEEQQPQLPQQQQQQSQQLVRTPKREQADIKHHETEEEEDDLEQRINDDYYLNADETDGTNVEEDHDLEEEEEGDCDEEEGHRYHRRHHHGSKDRTDEDFGVVGSIGKSSFLHQVPEMAATTSKTLAPQGRTSLLLQPPPIQRKQATPTKQSNTGGAHGSNSNNSSNSSNAIGKKSSARLIRRKPTRLRRTAAGAGGAGDGGTPPIFRARTPSSSSQQTRNASGNSPDSTIFPPSLIDLIQSTAEMPGNTQHHQLAAPLAATSLAAATTITRSRITTPPRDIPKRRNREASPGGGGAGGSISPPLLSVSPSMLSTRKINQSPDIHQDGDFLMNGDKHNNGSNDDSSRHNNSFSMSFNHNENSHTRTPKTKTFPNSSNSSFSAPAKAARTTPVAAAGAATTTTTTTTTMTAPNAATRTPSAALQQSADQAKWIIIRIPSIQSKQEAEVITSRLLSTFQEGKKLLVVCGCHPSFCGSLLRLLEPSRNSTASRIKSALYPFEQMAERLGINFIDDEVINHHVQLLGNLVQGMHLTQRVTRSLLRQSFRLEAVMLVHAELLSSRIFFLYLEKITSSFPPASTSIGTPQVQFLDARTVLSSKENRRDSDQFRYLGATCDESFDPVLSETLDNLGGAKNPNLELTQTHLSGIFSHASSTISSEDSSTPVFSPQFSAPVYQYQQPLPQQQPQQQQQRNESAPKAEKKSSISHRSHISLSSSSLLLSLAINPRGPSASRKSRKSHRSSSSTTTTPKNNSPEAAPNSSPSISPPSAKTPSPSSAIPVQHPQDAAGPQAAEERRYVRPASVIITQCAAMDIDGETVVVGRDKGRADICAAYFAVKLKAARMEVWSLSQFAGFFTANPSTISNARLIPFVDYDESQELATQGSAIIHPSCLPIVRRGQIPVYISSLKAPNSVGTWIATDSESLCARGNSLSCVQKRRIDSNKSRIKAIFARKNVVLISMETVEMWQQPGFLATIFSIFSRHQVSIGMVGTSETNVTVSLDVYPNAKTLTKLMGDLNDHCKATITDSCLAITFVGKGMRSILHRLAPALEVFSDNEVRLISQAALNMTFVIDGENVDSDDIMTRLHSIFFSSEKGPNQQIDTPVSSIAQRQ